jgi:hypothetical protein
MNRNEQARDAVAEEIVRTNRPVWDTLPLERRDQALQRLCKAAGIDLGQAVKRMLIDSCPHCGSSNLDRGETGLDMCNGCGGLSRSGLTLAEAEEWKL